MVAPSATPAPFPEEFFLLLAFFHLAHVARYEPVFLYKLKETRGWPVVEALKAHGLALMMRLFISFAMKKAIVLNAI